MPEPTIRIPEEPREIKLSESEEDDLVNRVQDDWSSDNEARGDLRATHEDYLKQYRGDLATKTWPWPDCSNLHIPITFAYVETVHPMLLSQLWDDDEPVRAKSTKPEGVKGEAKVSHFMNWELRDHMKAREVLDDTLHDTEIAGVSVVKTTWTRETQVRRFIEVTEEDVYETIPIYYQERDALTGRQSPPAMLDGAPVQIGEREVFSETREVETERTEEKVVYEGPVIDRLIVDDFCVPAGYSDVQKAPHVIHRYWLAPNEVQDLADADTFENVDEDLLKSGTRSRDGSQGQAQVQDDQEGVAVSEPAGEGEAPIEFLEWYGLLEFEKDEGKQEVIVTVAKEANKLVRVAYLTDVYAHGRRPFVDFHFVKVPGRFYSIGVCQILEGLQDEINDVFNKMRDNSDITTTPWGWFSAGSGIDPTKFTISPGKLNPVDDVGAVKFAEVPDHTQWFQVVTNMILSYAERVLGISDYTAGVATQKPNTPKTATMGMAMMQQTRGRLGLIVGRHQDSFRELLQQIQGLNVQYLPEDVVIRVSGSAGADDFIGITRDELVGDYHYLITGQTRLENKQAERETILFLTQTLAPYLMQGAAQNPQVYALLERLLQAYDIRDHEEILGPKPPAPDLPIAQERENAQMFSGEEVKIHQGDDDVQHLEIIDKMTKSPEWAIVPEDNKPLYSEHAQAHQQQQQQKMMQAQMMQQQMMQAQMMGAPGGMPAGGSPSATTQQAPTAPGAQMRPPSWNPSTTGSVNGEPPSGISSLLAEVGQ